MGESNKQDQQPVTGCLPVTEDPYYNRDVVPKSL